MRTRIHPWGIVAMALLPLAAVHAQSDAGSLALRRSPTVAVVEQVRDAIVNISCRLTVQRPRSMLDEIFQLPNMAQTTKIGSGFVIHEDGYLVTNNHVVDRSADLTVTFADGREYEARIVARDSAHDLAVLKIDPESSLPAVRLGHSDDLMIGETAIAVGNPLGYQNTVTTGVISALHRTMDFPSGATYSDLIQTDASINAGNSGGPLFNVLGEVIGVNTAIRGDAQNIGFAIPVDHLRKFLPEMLDVGRLRQLDTGMRVAGELQPRVIEVQEGGPAERAGVRVGDIIEQIDDRPIRRNVDYSIAMLAHAAGERVPLLLKRDGRDQRVLLPLAELPKPDGAILAQQRFGLRLAELAPEAARRYGIRPGSGLMIVGLDRDSAADAAGLRVGDLLVQVGPYAIRSLDQIGQLLEKVGAGDVVEVGVWRFFRGEIHGLETRLNAR